MDDLEKHEVISYSKFYIGIRQFQAIQLSINKYRSDNLNLVNMEISPPKSKDKEYTEYSPNSNWIYKTIKFSYDAEHNYE